MLYLVFEAGLSMTQAERIRTLNDAITVLENNQSKIAQFNTMINNAVTAQNMKKITQKSLSKGYTIRR
jgi:hypothetical protein